MPELKHNFLQGKMNKDLDERLVPNGQYRDALNVEVSTSEGSEVGTVQNIKGNVLTTFNASMEGKNFNLENAITVGSIADESLKSIFNFVHKACDFVASGYYASGIRFKGVRCDAITKYTPDETQESGTTYPMVVDVYEARLLADVQTTNNGIIKPQMFDEIAVGGSATSYRPLGVRVGMRVQLVGPDGVDLYVGQEIVVTAVNAALNQSEVSIVTTKPGFDIIYTQDYIDAGYIFKFTSTRILNFKAGTTETESNVVNTPTSNTPLKTSITGINVEDGILFYTDGRNEPKRIVLERFELKYNNSTNTAYYNSPTLFRHSFWRYRNKNGLNIFKPLEEKYITVIRPNPLEPPVVKATFTKREPGPISIGGTTFAQQYSNSVVSAVNSLTSLEDIEDGASFKFADGSNTLFTPGHDIIVRSLVERVHWKTNDVIEFTGATSGAVVTCEITAHDTNLVQGDDDFDIFTLSFIDASEGYYEDGTNQLISTIAETWVGILKEKDTIYPEKFIYFAYRYKYLDNERSCISPYSKAIFSPGIYSYNSLAGFNFGMNNRLKTVEVKDFIPTNIPDDVVEVEILLKESNSDNLYLVKNIKRHTSEWDTPGNTYFGSVLIESEVFGSSIPSSQLLRIFDGVPKKAESQEFSSSRLLFGNYTEGYNLLDHDLSSIIPSVSQYFDVTHSEEDFKTSFESINVCDANWLIPTADSHTLLTGNGADLFPHNQEGCTGLGFSVGTELDTSPLDNNPWFTGLYDFFEGNGGVDGAHWENSSDVVMPSRKKFDVDWWGLSDRDNKHDEGSTDSSIKRHPYLRFGTLSVFDKGSTETSFANDEYRWLVAGPPHTPVVNAGINATVESTASDPGNNYNNTVPHFLSGNYDNPRGPFYTAPVSGNYTFKASTRLSFNDAFMRSGGGASRRCLSEVFRMAMCFVKCDPNGELLLNADNFESPYNITTKNTDRPVWQVKQGGNVLSRGGLNRVYGLRTTINNDDQSYCQELEDELAENGGVYEWGSKLFSNTATVYLNAGERMSAAMIYPYTYLSEATRNATFNPDGGSSSGALDWREQFVATTSNGIASPFPGYNHAPDYNFGFQSRNSTFECIAAPTQVREIVSSQAKESVKSDRTYQTGVVYLDDYGRESTVLVDEKRIESLPKYRCELANRIRVKIFNNAPYWAKYYKIFIKEIAKEYYNIPLYKAYSVDEDDEQLSQFVWLSFSSHERNKVKLEDSLVLKKEHGTNNAVTDKNARWRIIDIVDAPRKVDDADDEIDGAQAGFALGSLTVPATADEIEGKFFVKIQSDSEVDDYLSDPGEGGLADTDKILNGALFEVESPRQSDLDLFYEISQAFPIFLSEKDASMYIKKGFWIASSDHDFQAGFESDWQFQGDPGLWSSWNDTAQVISITGASTKDGYCRLYISQPLPGFIYATEITPVKIDFNELNPAIEKGSFVRGWITSNHASGSNYIDIYPFTHNLSTTPIELRDLDIRLPWFNCFAFGNGVESDRIRDDFNSGVIYPYTAAGKASGFKATIPDADYSEVTKKNDIIFSQIYNDASNVARYNEFLLAEDITKKLNSEYGSIQKLYTRQGDVIAFCESKVVKILANKDALFNADGDQQLLSSTAVLGQATPFAGDYGISKNPESFAVEEYRIYFTDRDRGAVCRLSMDGITAISDAGMKDFFNDNLQKAQALIGSYDGKKNEYNLTMHSLISSNSSKNVRTLSFSEAVKGWTSFKSFIKESGVSLSNNYYTFKKGEMWLHHPDLTSEDRCNFYGIQNNSTLTALFNDTPGVVKLFKTVNYEGTQSKVSDTDEFGVFSTAVPESYILNYVSPAAWWKFETDAASAQWNDQSGNENHLVQSTSDDQPVYNSNTGGFAFTTSTEFDFTTQLNLDARTIIFAIDFTIPKTAGHANFHILMNDASGSATQNLVQAYLPSDNFYIGGADGTTVVSDVPESSITTGTKSLLTYTMTTQAEGGIMSIRLNGVQVGSSITNVGDDGNGTYNRLGRIFDRGFQGNIYEVVVFSEVLSDSQLVNVENEIINRVGIV